MRDIEKIRSEIDQIHSELATLFRKRLELTHQIWEIKKANDLPFTDQSRENLIVHRFDESIQHEGEKKAVQNFFKNIISETKKYLEERLK